MKPRIALTAGLTRVDLGPRYRTYGEVAAESGLQEKVQVRVDYVDVVEAAGGEPVVLAPLPGEARARRLLDVADGLLLTGGEDLNPQLWGERPHPETSRIDTRRQQSDLELVHVADAAGVPVLGICLGCQEMAVSRGGRIIQHVPDEGGPVIVHSSGTHPRATHPVMIEPRSLLGQIVGAERLLVNSGHHQAVRDPGRGMRIVARSPDGIIEAIEDPAPGRFFLGVQWHPEDLRDEPAHLALFEALCRAAATYRPA